MSPGCLQTLAFCLQVSMFSQDVEVVRHEYEINRRNNYRLLIAMEKSRKAVEIKSSESVRALIEDENN
jgi:hypothetical protein